MTDIADAEVSDRRRVTPYAASMSFETSQTRVRTVEDKQFLYVRRSAKNRDTLVIGVVGEEGDDSARRAVLVRLNDDGSVKIRTLDGNPREASSKTETQRVLTVDADDMSEDPHW